MMTLCDDVVFDHQSLNLVSPNDAEIKGLNLIIHKSSVSIKGDGGIKCLTQSWGNPQHRVLDTTLGTIIKTVVSD